jgi:cytidine deaminase
MAPFARLASLLNLGNTALSRRKVLSVLALLSPTHTTMELNLSLSGAARLDAGRLRKLAPWLSAESRDRLLRVLKDPSLRGRIPAAETGAVAASERMTVDELAIALLPVAQLFSEPPLSNFRVGAVLRGTSGNLYLGANIEVPGQMLGFSVHAEQAAVANAYMQGERGVACLAITVAPCGHCRQFLNELPNAPDLTLLVKGSGAIELRALLPQPFGPKDLGVTDRLFSGKRADLELLEGVSDELSLAALQAAAGSYAPYTKAYSGVAVLSSMKAVYTGAYLENAAFNPSLSPLQGALVSLVMGGEKPQAIAEAVLVDLENAPISQSSATRAVLDAFAPAARLRHVPARLKR